MAQPMKAQFLFDLDQPAVRNHTAYGQHLLPGLAYIDFLYQFFRARGYDASSLELRNLTIYRPLIVRHDRPVRCDVEAMAAGAGIWRIAVRDQQETATADNRTMYASAEMHAVSVRVFEAALSPAAIGQISAADAVPMDAIYERCRRYEVMQTGFMKAEGMVSYSDTEMLADLHVGPEAAAVAGRLIFHPALMDAAAVCAASALARFVPSDEIGLALPIHYESFRASAALQRRCIVRARAAAMARRGVARYMTLEFFDESGQQVGELVNLAATVVREPALIDPTRAPSSTPKLAARGRTAASGAAPASEMARLLRRLVAERLRRPAAEIDAAAGYYEMGLDSVALLELARAVERALNVRVPPTLFFEHTTIAQLAAHLVEAHGPPPASDGAQADEGRTTVAPSPQRRATIRERDVAVIAVAGRHPQARDLETFWENLKAGRDCISEIPSERWDAQAYFSVDHAPGKSRSKWGGFIDGVDEFDPLFFGIAPREAELVDPQVRLFLETVWHLLEAAGCTRARLQTHYQGSVGVYVGAMYQLYGSLDTDVARQSVTAISSYAAIANRVSYWFGLNGPSVAIDTLCSSSLAAVHMACMDLVHGECGLAIVGGVNLSIHPKKYVGLSQLQLLAGRAERRSFADGDGLIPAEAVGAVLLKPLANAIEDGDDVLAVIKGTATNHGGRSSGFAVPSLDAEARLIRASLKAANVHPRAISYVEAAATGAALSDAVEVAALQKVFGERTPDRQFCAIGSVKSNIGHAEAASGITQLIKVILQLRHGQLVPSIGAEPANPHFSFDDTAFRLQRDLSPWVRPTIVTGGTARERARCALINSFGAGGSNASAVVEEYVRDDDGLGAAERGAGPHVMVFSARTEERLREVVRQTRTYLQHHDEVALSDLAFTLQCGREPMASRLAMVVDDRHQLICAMETYLEEPPPGAPRPACPPFYTGRVSGSESVVRELALREGGDALVRRFLDPPDLVTLAVFWTDGADVPWHELAGTRGRRIVPLPPYPFARVRCWLSHAAGADAPAVASLAADAAGVPRTELERTIAAVWENVLGISGIGIHDRFLDLGGSSFTGVQVCTRLRELFDVEIPVSLLIGPHATVETLAVETVCGLARQHESSIEAHLDAVV